MVFSAFNVTPHSLMCGKAFLLTNASVLCYNPQERKKLCPPPGGKSIGAVSAGLLEIRGAGAFFIAWRAF